MKLSERVSQLLIKRQMSKKGSTSLNKSSKQTTISEGNCEHLSPISTAKNGDYLISILVKPGSKFNCVTDISPEAVSLQISAPPMDGEANAEIVKFFSELLKLKKTEVDLRGAKSRQKIIVISSKNVNPSTILETLKSNLGEKF